MPEKRQQTVISNTSPLFYLHQIGQLDLLHQLYGTVYASDQVVDELCAGGISSSELDACSWLRSRRGVHIPRTLRMIPDLGLGEASAIALAMKINDSVLLLLDDGLARRIAKLNSLPLTGTAGILIKAKESGFIIQVRPLLERMINLGFYLRSDHLSMIYKLAGE